MSTTSVSFYDLPVTVGGIEWQLSCDKLDVSYNVQYADTSVGESGCCAIDIEIEDDELKLFGYYRTARGGWSDDHEFTVKRGMYAFTQVENAAYVTIEQQASDAANEEDDYFDENANSFDRDDDRYWYAA